MVPTDIKFTFQTLLIKSGLCYQSITLGIYVLYLWHPNVLYTYVILINDLLFDKKFQGIMFQSNKAVVLKRH